MIMKTGLGLVAISVLFSGCGYNAPSPKILKNNNYSDGKLLSVDYDIKVDLSAALFMRSAPKKENFKYAFAIAANLAKKNNLQYFAVRDGRIGHQFKERKVTNMQEAYDACASGDGSFNFFAAADGGAFFKATNCDTLIYDKLTPMNLQNSSYPLTLNVTLLSEDRKDNLTFDADEVLNSSIIKELDMSKIADVKVVE